MPAREMERHSQRPTIKFANLLVFSLHEDPPPLTMSAAQDSIFRHHKLQCRFFTRIFPSCFFEKSPALARSKERTGCTRGTRLAGGGRYGTYPCDGTSMILGPGEKARGHIAHVVPTSHYPFCPSPPCFRHSFLHSIDFCIDISILQRRRKDINNWL